MVKLRQISNSQSNFQQKQNLEETKYEAKKSGSNGLKIVAFALTGFTLGLGYVYANQESRRHISSSLPQANDLFNYIDIVLGRENLSKSRQSEVDNKIKINPSLNQQSSLVPQPIIKSEENKPEKNVFKAMDEPIKISNVPKNVSVNSESDKSKSQVGEKEPVKKITPNIQIVDAKVKNKTDEFSQEDLDWKNSLKKLELQEEASILGKILQL